MSDIRNNGKNVKDPEPGPKPAGVGSIGHVWFLQCFFAHVFREKNLAWSTK